MRTDSEEAIRRSIIHSLLGDLDEQESRTLENWLKTPEHQDFYKKISNREYVRCKMAGLELSDKEKARERLKMNIARRIERYRRRKWWGRVAESLFNIISLPEASRMTGREEAVTLSARS